MYESYVSSKQAAFCDDEGNGFEISDYPYLCYVLNKHLPSEKTLRIVDLGCGHGTLVFCLKELGYSAVEGVDVSIEQVQLAHKMGMTEIVHGDLFTYLKDNSRGYDVIFLMDVLEHLEKQEVIDLLTAIKSSLKETGQLILHVPNAEGLFGMRVRYGDFTHENCFTPQSINQVLRATGFNEISVYEDIPIVHGVKSFIRYLLWRVLTFRVRLLLMAETGSRGHVLSQNMLVVARNV